MKRLDATDTLLPARVKAAYRQRLLEGRRLIVASNRGPLEYRLAEDGTLKARRGAGGVVSALAALGQYTELRWICAALTEGDRVAARRVDKGEVLPRPASLPSSLEVEFVVVPEETFDRHYNVISNPILWFVQHFLWSAAYGPTIDLNVRDAWEHGYVAVNRAFAEQVIRQCRTRPGERSPFILLHDYQLYLTPGLVRARCPEAFLSHFVHIPWPGPIYWQLLPEDMRHAIVESLCYADIVGFQTDQFARNFLDTCDAFLDDVVVDREKGTVVYRGHVARVRTYPISIDVGQLRETVASPAMEKYLPRIGERIQGRKAIVRVDRLDLSKNILRGFQAYRLFLERHPERRGEVTFLAFLVPSRTSIPEYQRYKERVLKLVDEINAHYGTADWQPIQLFYENNFLQALAGMRLADVMMVNPVVDGMNLVAKEAMIVNDRDAVLILSEGAGAHQQLGDYALSVGVADIEGTAQAIERALTMPASERSRRAAALRNIVERFDLEWWIDTQLADLDALATKRQPAPKSAVLA